MAGQKAFWGHGASAPTRNISTSSPQKLRNSRGQRAMPQIVDNIAQHLLPGRPASLRWLMLLCLVQWLYSMNHLDV